MAVYPITLPASPGARRVTKIGRNSSGISVSPWTLEEQVQLNQGQAWRFSIELPPMNEAQARAWFAALLSLNGNYGTFYFGSPIWKAPLGSWAGSPVVAGAGQVGTTLAIGGLNTGATGKAGDYFQINSGAASRLHMLTADFAESGGGATLEIWPRLREAPGDTTPLVVSSPKGIFRLASPDVALAWEPFTHGITIDIAEAL